MFSSAPIIFIVSYFGLSLISISLFFSAAAASNLHKNGIESWMILDDLIRVGVLLLVRFKVQDAASHHIVVLIDRPYSQSTHQRLGVLHNKGRIKVVMIVHYGAHLLP